MKDARDKIERQKRKVGDLIVTVLAKAKTYENHPHHDKADRLRGAAKHLQAADHAMFMATVCLLEGDKSDL